ncbi:MAG: D-alanyl-D-alanine carboxypeptidase [Oscillospiraceae bacterium]|nr:D-alanyl-D-alanine carboxypeptidase [Oscillospiraceae bacterium]
MKKLICIILLVFLILPAFLTAGAAGDAVVVAGEASESLRDTSMKVTVRAKAALLMEASTGRVLMAMNENDRLSPASVTKIMSMLLVCEAIGSGKISLADRVPATPEAVSKGGSQIWLEVGEEMTVEELLKAVAVYSANDACTLLGEYIAGSDEGFTAMMNGRAKELGMNSTNFENCTGLDDTAPNHLTSAYDIALMSRELLKHPFIIKYTTIWMDSLRGGKTELVNTNKLVRFYNGITGLKTGTTNKAGCCLSATAERNGLSLISVVLGSDSSDDRFNGAKAMLDWGFANYEVVMPELDMRLVTPVKVLHGLEQEVMPQVPGFMPVLTKKGSKNNISGNVSLVTDVEAPVVEGQVLGKISFYLNEELLSEYNLVSGKNIEKMTFGKAFMRQFRAFGAN